MRKTIQVASMASTFYFIISIILKFSLQNAIIDWKNALLGAMAFWFIIFFIYSVHNRAKPVPR